MLFVFFFVFFCFFFFVKWITVRLVIETNSHTLTLTEMNKIEDIIENINGFGKYQKIRYILICLSGLLPPIASYMHQFIAASPKYR